MKTDEQDAIDLISRYLDNALSAEETGTLLEKIRTDQAAADLFCELTIQHVQLRRIFKKDEEVITRPAFSTAHVSGRFRPMLRPLALAACLAIIAGAGLWLAEFLRERDAKLPCQIVLLKIGQGIEDAGQAEAVSAGTTVMVPAGTIQLVRFQDETIFQLLPGTAAQIVDTGSASSGKTIKLTTGTIIGDVARQTADFPLRVITPHLEVIVAGTRFTCEVEEDHTHVCMHHGWAHIIHNRLGEKIRLLAGQHVTAGERFHFRVRSIHEGEY